jgi:hypothetical protein
MDPNYDHWNDFFGDDGLEAEVSEYLRLEWMIELDSLPHKTKEQTLEIIGLMRGKDNVPNIAGKVAMEVITLGDLLRNPHGMEQGTETPRDET